MRLVYDVHDLLRRYQDRPRPAEGTFVTLSGLDGHDAYNPSAPIPDGSSPYIYARVEQRDDEFSSWSIPFRQKDLNRWDIEADLPMFQLQDPATCVINGTIVVSGVRIVAKVRDRVIFRSVFMRGASPETLEEFLSGPLYMKDVRLVELENGGIGIFSRPLGGVGGRGRIGYTEVCNLDDLTAGTIAAAPLLETQPVPDQWWGTNHVYALGGDLLGVLAHIAAFDEHGRNYYPIVFTFDCRRRMVVDGPEIIADRSRFPAYPPKRPDLENVMFPAWIDREKGLLLSGVSDSAIGLIEVGDPFSR